MRFFNIFSVCLLAFVFSACEPQEPRKVRGKASKKQNPSQYQGVIMLHLYKTVEGYKELVSLLKEEQKIYDEILDIYFKINTIHNDLLKQQASNVEVLENLKQQMEVLDQMIKNIDWPLEVHEKLQVIKKNIENVQKVLKDTSEQQKKVEEAETSKEAPSEKTESSNQDPSQTAPPEQNTENSGDQAITTAPAAQNPAGEEEEATSSNQDPVGELGQSQESEPVATGKEDEGNPNSSPPAATEPADPIGLPAPEDSTDSSSSDPEPAASVAPPPQEVAQTSSANQETQDVSQGEEPIARTNIQVNILQEDKIP